jgi:hypothetical protein
MSHLEERMFKHKTMLLFATAAVLIVLGCSSPRPEESPLMVTSPVEPLIQSPLSVGTAAVPGGPRFTLDLPLKAGDTTVRGTGMPGVPLRVVNVTQMASELGRGIVESDGSFEIQLVEGLPPQERIGLMLGDLGDSAFQKTDFIAGPGYTDIPYIGVVFTSTLTSP